MKAYPRFCSNRYELVLLFKPYYLDRTPSPATTDRIKKRYEKVTPGELAHIDLTKVPKVEYITPYERLEKVTELLS